MRWWQLFYNGNNRSLGTRGMYQVDAQWYDPTHGRLIQPLDATNYDQSLGLSVGGLITAIRVGSWICPPVGYSINLVANIVDRLAPLNGDAGQPWDQALAGGFLDTIGLTDLIGGFTNYDYVTQKDLKWSTGERWFHGISGTLQFLPVAGLMAKAVLPVIGGGVAGFGNSMQNFVIASGRGGAGIAVANWINTLGPSVSLAGRGISAAGGALGGLSTIPAGLGSIGNAVFSMGSSNSLPIRTNEVTTYRNFSSRKVSRPYDGIEGHELLQHAWIEKNIAATTRGSGYNLLCLDPPNHCKIMIL